MKSMAIKPLEKGCQDKLPSYEMTSGHDLQFYTRAQKLTQPNCKDIWKQVSETNPEMCNTGISY